MAPLTEGHNTSIGEFVPALDRLAADVMADWKVPGAALAVVQDGKVALAKAYGQRDVEANLPNFSRPAHRNDAHAFGAHGGISAQRTKNRDLKAPTLPADLAPPLRNRWFADSPLEGDGFEPSVPGESGQARRSM
jgi:hypothetical protein